MQVCSALQAAYSIEGLYWGLFSSPFAALARTMAHYTPGGTLDQKSAHYPNPGLRADVAVSMDNLAEPPPPPAYNTEPATVNYVVSSC